MTGGQVRRWRPDWPCPATQILLAHRRGGGDPTYRIDAGGRHWRGVRTPEGPATLVVRSAPGDREIIAEAWGSGATWMLASIPALLGADDDWTGFEPQHPVVEQAQRLHPHWRLGRTGLVMESLVPSIIEQKVTGQEAFLGFRRLVTTYGEPAPGPGAEHGLWLQPDAETLRGIPSWGWLKIRVDQARSLAVSRAAQRSSAVERIASAGFAEADRRLRSLPGVGVWTSAEVRARALGDPDAVSFGDYHVAKDVGWALTGAPVDDAELAELLQPWAGHRFRVQALLGLAGLQRPRHGPRMAPRSHLPD